MVDLLPSRDDDVTSEALVTAIDPALRTALGMKVNYVLYGSTLQQSIGSGEAPITVQVRGPNLDTLRSLTDTIAARMAELPEVYNVRTRFEGVTLK